MSGVAFKSFFGNMLICLKFFKLVWWHFLRGPVIQQALVWMGIIGKLVRKNLLVSLLVNLMWLCLAPNVLFVFFPKRLSWCPGVSLTSWAEGASLVLVGHPFIDDVTIKLPCRVAVLIYQPASDSIFPNWIG